MAHTETWYVLDDGDVVSPADVEVGKGGALKHADGRAVQMKGDVPRTRSIDPAAIERGRARAKADADAAAAKAERDMKAGERKPAYATRESKAD